MNIRSLSRLSFVVAAFLVVAGAAQPTRAFGSQTGTLPVIVKPNSELLVAGTKDNGSLPVIIVPSTTSVHGDGGGSGLSDQTFTVTVTLNNVTTTDQSVELTSSHSNLIHIDSNVVVPAGSNTATATFTVPYNSHRHHKNVHLAATCNGTTVDCVVQVHFHNEED